MTQTKLKRLLIFMAIMSCMLIIKENVHVNAAAYKTTKYKSLSAVEKNYRKTCTQKGGSGIYSSYQTIKNILSLFHPIRM